MSDEGYDEEVEMVELEGDIVLDELTLAKAVELSQIRAAISGLQGQEKTLKASIM